MSLNILVCVKRVPATGARIVLTDDARAIDTRNLGFAVSPHEECAVEEAVRIAEAQEATTTVLTLGPEEATEQLREALALGIDRAVLLPTDDGDWGPMPTAQALVAAIRAQQEAHGPFDLLLFGNESADSGGYQVAVRVAHALDLPCVSGIKKLDVSDGIATARRETADGYELFEVALPAVITVKEGINLPRYPSLPGRLRAKKKEIERFEPPATEGGLIMQRLRVPQEQKASAEILGQGAAAVPRAVEVLRQLRMVD